MFSNGKKKKKKENIYIIVIIYITVIIAFFAFLEGSKNVFYFQRMSMFHSTYNTLLISYLIWNRKSNKINSSFILTENLY